MNRKVEDWAIKRVLSSPFTLWPKVLALPPREAVIIVLRFGLDGEQELTLRECGQIFEMSPQRVFQLQQRAIGKLRDSFGLHQTDDLRRCIGVAHPFGMGVT